MSRTPLYANRALPALLVLSLPLPAWATSSPLSSPSTAQKGGEETLLVTAKRSPPFTQSAETTALFRDVPGFNAWDAGGTTNLPALNGMAADRVASFVDGMRLGTDCPNEMNPALSLVSPDMVGTATAVAGITSVSEGGDSTGGTVSVTRRDPQFSQQKGHVLGTGEGRGDWGSNGGRSGASGSVTVATDQLSLRYSGAYAHATDYTAGGRGGKVPSTSYLTFNQAVTAGLKHENHQLVVTFSQQDVPYEAFPNQYMDETNNRTTMVNGKYTGTFNWGVVEARGFWERVIHAMNTLGDKGGHSATKGMPMNSDGREAGYDLRTTINLTATQILRVGSTYEHHGLNDWWPPIQGSMMMGPGTWNDLNNGRRNHLGNFVQWNAQWHTRFATEMGMRSDLVMMNTGPVSPYSWGMGSMMMGHSMMNMPDIKAAHAFNAAHRGRTDSNFDATVLGKWEALTHLRIEGGWARKTRSPNLYERYAWGMGGMAAHMIGWFGDGNGYVGNLNLKPEVANTASLTFRLHSLADVAAQGGWEVMVQPFYTYTHNYIDVRRIARLSNGTQELKFGNHRAQSYGINASAQTGLWNTPTYGQGHVSAVLSWVRGQDLTMHSGLYQQMPLNGVITLHEQRGPWSGQAALTLVKAKNTVDWVRNEPHTPGYALLGVGGGYRWHMLRLDVSLDNLLNQRYALPLGGRALSVSHPAGTLAPPVLAMGRSVNLTLRGRF